ncbi:hypothetical protein MMC14_007410 [Varicellaria rhodocarpa]|nr:hypothetical protein [Varicellaria rhodocarpa]
MASSYNNEEKGESPNSNSPSSALSFLEFMKYVFSKSRRSRLDNYIRETTPSALQTSTTTAVGQQPSTLQSPPHLHDHDGPMRGRDKLATFRRITGITSGQAHKDEHRPAKNVGIYARVVRNEKQAQDAFKLSSHLINGCLALQLIVAAALTALGAGDGPHAAVTVFGAVNTVIAGFLTYLKGSGLPNRHKFYASSWGKVREYMEQREREFEREDCPLDVEEVIRKVEDMYEEVRQDVEANEPEAYTSTGQLKRNEGLTPGPLISDMTGEYARRPPLLSGRPTALSTARIASYGKTAMAPHVQEYPYHPPFGDAKSPGPGAERFSAPDNMQYNLGGAVGDNRSLSSPPPPQVRGYPPATTQPGFYAPPSSFPFPNSNSNPHRYPPHLSPVDQLDHQTQESMQASIDKIQSAKRIEAGMEETLCAQATGVEKLGAHEVNEVRETVAREIEEERVQAARRMGDGVEMVKRAGEERVQVAAGMFGRVEGALSERLKKLEGEAKELI